MKHIADYWKPAVWTVIIVIAFTFMISFGVINEIVLQYFSYFISVISAGIAVVAVYATIHIKGVDRLANSHHLVITATRRKDNTIKVMVENTGDTPFTVRSISIKGLSLENISNPYIRPRSEKTEILTFSSSELNEELNKDTKLEVTYVYNDTYGLKWERAGTGKPEKMQISKDS